MQQERTSFDSVGGSYTFFFQIANEGGRRACCVKVDASNMHEAAALFRQKWPAIEAMARDGIKGGGPLDGVITLVGPLTDQDRAISNGGATTAGNGLTSSE